MVSSRTSKRSPWLIPGLLVWVLTAQQAFSGPAESRQVFRWSAQVGGVERILIRGDQVQLIHDKDPAAAFDTYYMTSPLPRQKAKLRIKKLRGRGKVKLLQKPTARNGYTAMVLIKDGKGGADDYEFELSWKGPSVPFSAHPVTVTANADIVDEVAPTPEIVAPLSPRFVWPLVGDILSGFGAPRGSRRHAGLDIRGPRGAQVVASRSGRVVYSGSGLGGYGKTVIVDHGDGVRTLYAHNSQLLVRLGQSVSQGEVIARVGRTGRATTDHCHFEIQQNKKAVNPLSLLPAR